jgi:hypothetical protein
MAVTSNSYTGNGSQTGYNFTFKWLRDTDIDVTVNNVLQTVGTDYTLSGLNYTSRTGGTINFTVAPVNGAAIRIYRVTADDDLSAGSFNAGSAIRAVDLNENYTQILYRAQEVSNYSVQDTGNVTLTANYTFSGTVSGPTPTASGHLATKDYVDGVAFASGNLTVGDKGDVTVNSATSWTIDNSAITTAKIANGAVTSAKLDTAYVPTSGIGSTVQAYDANTAKTNVVQAFSAAQRGTYVTLTDAATIATDLSLGNNFQVTLGGNRTLGAPTNVVAGQSGIIRVVQDGTGSRTLAYNSVWKFPGGTAPTLTTTANAVDLLAYHVESATRIAVRFIGDVK